MRSFIQKTNWPEGIDKAKFNKGWGNGYVAIPPHHKLHGQSYDKIDPLVEVHGGLTFAEDANKMIGRWEKVTLDFKDCWIVGFDTAHYQDSMETCPRSFVKAETKSLMEQLQELK